MCKDTGQTGKEQPAAHLLKLTKQGPDVKKGWLGCCAITKRGGLDGYRKKAQNWISRKFL